MWINNNFICALYYLALVYVHFLIFQLFSSFALHSCSARTEQKMTCEFIASNYKNIYDIIAVRIVDSWLAFIGFMCHLWREIIISSDARDSSMVVDDIVRACVHGYGCVFGDKKTPIMSANYKCFRIRIASTNKNSDSFVRCVITDNL